MAVPACKRANAKQKQKAGLSRGTGASNFRFLAPGCRCRHMHGIDKVDLMYLLLGLGYRVLEGALPCPNGLVLQSPISVR